MIPLPITSSNADAVKYVGTKPDEGLVQLKILQSQGCVPHHKVLDIGCGALIAGFPIMQFLENGNYAGIEPNRWLIDASRSSPEIEHMIVERCARFLYNENFDGTRFGPFDFILSHNVLSHAAMWQVGLFMDECRIQLKPTGKAIVSLRLAEGNRYGSRRSRDFDEHFQDWIFPENTYFKRDTIMAEATRRGLAVSFKEEWTEMMASVNPAANHDWIALTHRV